MSLAPTLYRCGLPSRRSWRTLVSSVPAPLNRHSFASSSNPTTLGNSESKAPALSKLDDSHEHLLLSGCIAAKKAPVPGIAVSRTIVAEKNGSRNHRSTEPWFPQNRGFHRTVVFFYRTVVFPRKSCFPQNRGFHRTAVSTEPLPPGEWVHKAVHFPSEYCLFHTTASLFAPRGSQIWTIVHLLAHQSRYCNVHHSTPYTPTK